MDRRPPEYALFLMVGLLAAMLAIPFALPRQADDGGARAAGARSRASHRGGEGTQRADEIEPSSASRKGEHGHDLDPSEPHWYLTVHGGDELADVFALDATGRVIGGVLGSVPQGPSKLEQLRGISLTGDGRLAVVNAYMKSSRILLFGPPNENLVRPYLGVWVQEEPANPGLVHPYQTAIAPDGTLYVSNQDTNTVTRYRGLGSPQPGQPMAIPDGLKEFGTLPAGTIVPNSQHSPEGIHEVRGIAFGPDGLLYVADRAGQSVSTYDTQTGRRTGVVFDKAKGLGHPIQLLMTPDHQAMLVGDNLHHCVWRVDLKSREAQQLVKPGSGGLNAPSALAIDGSHLLVGSRLGKTVLRYRLADGAYVGVFARLQSNPEFLIPTTQK